ncbi:hypothetical protein [Ilumatobacter nonamiensis]|uniref:hypothetical protein n=1 Tax=Ilumatobacter nonamiensis TaxID=467093 RepID=UPI00034BF5F1|nr:hypothetical protein [Ilumatobacter nonamiensis]
MWGPNGRFGELVVGWAFVFVAALLVVGMVGRAILGNSESLWEWPAMLAIAALILFVGIANLAKTPPPWMVPAVLGSSGVFFLVMGVSALLAPAVASRLLGGVVSSMGALLLVECWQRSRRRKRSGRGR